MPVDESVPLPGAPRIGAVSYLNSKPLIEGLNRTLSLGLTLDYPSRLAAALQAGELDAALVPSIEVLRNGNYQIVSDACVAARGPVRSVKVYFRVPPGEVRTLALDEGSRTSATLVRVLLHHKYGVDAGTEPLPLEFDGAAEIGSNAASTAVTRTRADAVLLIGDRAMFPVAESFVEVWDLGEEWLNWTGLPFVFAVWAARHDAPAGLAERLSAARDAGLASIEAIARREAVPLGIDPELAVVYLTKNLHFKLGPAERSGLRLFAQLAQQAGLIPDGADVVFREEADRNGTCDSGRRRTDDESPTTSPHQRERLIRAR